MNQPRFPVQSLIEFASALFAAVGCDGAGLVGQEEPTKKASGGYWRNSRSTFAVMRETNSSTGSDAT